MAHPPIETVFEFFRIISPLAIAYLLISLSAFSRVFRWPFLWLAASFVVRFAITFAQSLIHSDPYAVQVALNIANWVQVPIYVAVVISLARTLISIGHMDVQATGMDKQTAAHHWFFKQGVK